MSDQNLSAVLRARALAFFYANAGYSWNPATQTQDGGRRECAAKLAEAEDNAREGGYSFDWREDECDSSEWSDEKPPYTQWLCGMFNAEGEMVANLGCVDFGRNGRPWGNRHRRVVEAEIALDYLP